MMFRYGKIIETNNKSSRSDRFAEMSKQQQLIESKKQEIKAKFEEMKRKEANDLAMKSEQTPSSMKNKDFKSLASSRIQSWKNDERWRKKQNNTETSSSKSPSNISVSNDLFSNDGSFLEKYKQLANTKDTNETDHTRCRFDSEQSTENSVRDDTLRFNQAADNSAMPRTSGEGIPYPPPNLNLLPTTSSLNVTSQAQPLYSLTAHPPPSVPTTIHTSLAAVSASVSVLTAVSSAAPLQTVSLIQVPVSVPASSVILSCPLETTLVSSEPVVHLPVVHSNLSHSTMSVPLQTVPLQTTVIPAQIQITSQTALPSSAVQTVQINPSSTNVILSQTLQPQSILVSSDCVTQPPLVSTGLPNTNVPPPMLPVPPSQPPPRVPPSPVPPPMYTTVPPRYPVPPSIMPDTTKLPPVHLPPPNYNPVAIHHIEGVHAPVLDCKTSTKYEKDGFDNERTLITSKSDERQAVHVTGPRKIGNGRDDSSNNSLENIEAVAKLVADSTDDIETVLLSKSFEGEKFSFLRDKQSPPYIAFRAMVTKFRAEKKGEMSYSCGRNEASTSFEVENRRRLRAPADEDDSDSEEVEGKRKRRRKRRSRWAPEDTKVNLSVPVGAANSNIGLALPSSLGTIVPVAPPSQQNKLPGISGSLISQINRTDPALLQYALKAFGTVHLSEEDWKKAEDHYKINLLYQDMLKKRQELEKLQAAGKHKYAYDSDEDTAGGTWEHKLRTQEMVATQRWADELTERAKGKHHIGDFLPPDELERFMEKYNALKQGREPDLSDYKEFKLKEDNIGFQMLQKLGWSEGQGLGSDGSGIVNPVNKAASYVTSHGLGVEKPDDVGVDDDEYDAYRKRMMLAYRFRPNPLNNPRRPYY